MGDFNGDGRLDIVASNWGLNSPYHATSQLPIRIYYGNLSGRGTVDLLEASFDPELGDWAPMWIRDFLTASLPWIVEKYPTRRAYSEASMESILGERLGRANRLEASTLASMIFLNRGDRFEAIPLPAEAQFAPAYGVVLADFDGDGFQDLFLSQNFFDTGLQVPRLDAGRGLLLRGDGTGKFTAIPASESGLYIYGEGRGAACSDFNEDGRADLVVAQNGAKTCVFIYECGRRTWFTCPSRRTAGKPNRSGSDCPAAIRRPPWTGVRGACRQRILLAGQFSGGVRHTATTYGGERAMAWGPNNRVPRGEWCAGNHRVGWGGVR